MWCLYWISSTVWVFHMAELPNLHEILHDKTFLFILLSTSLQIQLTFALDNDDFHFKLSFRRQSVLRHKSTLVCHAVFEKEVDLGLGFVLYYHGFSIHQCLCRLDERSHDCCKPMYQSGQTGTGWKTLWGTQRKIDHFGYLGICQLAYITHLYQSKPKGMYFSSPREM